MGAHRCKRPGIAEARRCRGPVVEEARHCRGLSIENTLFQEARQARGGFFFQRPILKEALPSRGTSLKVQSSLAMGRPAAVRSCCSSLKWPERPATIGSDLRIENKTLTRLGNVVILAKRPAAAKISFSSFQAPIGMLTLH